MDKDVLFFRKPLPYVGPQGKLFDLSKMCAFGPLVMAVSE